MSNYAIKVRIYPTPEQSQILAQHMGSCRWFWNYALNLCVETYKETGKGLTQTAINSLLPKLKKEPLTEWLGEVYSQCLQSVSLNLSRAYLNFFSGRARYPRFKSYHGKQSIQYPQNVKVIDRNTIKFPGKVGVVRAKVHREPRGKVKTVTVSKKQTGKYYASILIETDTLEPKLSSKGKAIGID